SVEDLIARSQYQAPASPQAAPPSQLPPGPPLVTPEVPPEYQPEWQQAIPTQPQPQWQAGPQVNPSVYMPRGTEQVNPAVYMPRGGETPPAPPQRVPGPGFVDLLRSLVSGGEEQRLPFTYGSPLPPIQPLPTPIPQ